MLTKVKIISLIIVTNVVLAPGTLIVLSQLEQIFLHPTGNSSIGGDTQLLISYIIWNILLILFILFKFKNLPTITSVNGENEQKNISNIFIFTVVGIFGVLTICTLLYLGLLLLASSART